jgi:Tfp pilus assembly protein FimT
LIGLVAGLTTPVLISSLERIQNQAEVRKVASALRYARIQAITEKTPFVFHADIDNNKFWIESPATQYASRPIALSRGLKLVGFSDGAATAVRGEFLIVFNPQGNSSGGSVALESGFNANRIKYSVTLDRVTGKAVVDEQRE